MPQVTKTALTNERTGSVAQAQHSDPTITLMGRVAAGRVGNIGKLGPGGKKDLHFTLIIADAYSGIFGFDGQLTATDVDQFSINAPRESKARMSKIKTLFYRNTLPSNVILKIPVEPPPGMSKQLFAQELVRAAHNFASFTLTYSAPKNLVGEVMVEGTYNSSSYMAGLLNFVMGYVPTLSTSEYQTPGWETPIPTSYFKGEALR